MKQKKYSLGVVLGHPTQFEGPLFRQISKNPDIDLTVYYTTYGACAFDLEMKLRPHWDNDVTGGYVYKTRQRGLKNNIRFLKSILSAGHDLVVIAGYRPWYHFLIALAAWVKGLPTGLRSDSTFLYMDPSSLKARLKDLIIPRIFKFYDVAFPTGTLAGQYFVHFGFSQDRLFRFPYAVDNHYLKQRYDYYRRRRQALRRALKIEEAFFVVLGIIKFVEREDPMTLLKGFAIFVKDCPSAHLILVGDGPMKAKMQGMIQTASVPNVHFAGFVRYSRLPLFYSIADVFVHPPQNECWGVSVNEAMVCSLPVVVASTVGSHIDLVKPGETGFVFQAGDPKDLARYLLRICRDPSLNEEMGQRGYQLVQDWGFDGIEHSLQEALLRVGKKG